MSKQYLTTHTIDNAHPADIFYLASTPTQILSISSASSIKVYSTTEADFPLVQTIQGAHKLGSHHIVTNSKGSRAVSVGFGGETRIWATNETGQWVDDGKIKYSHQDGETWAVALSQDGQYLAGTTFDGRINVWDLLTLSREKIRQYETKGSLGMCIDLSADGRFTVSGHESGNIYIFSNDTGKLLHSLSSLVKPVRAVVFSPASKYLAAAGDSRVISIYDVQSGEHFANFIGHAAWVMSLDWSATGEYLLSGAFDGKVKVWSMEQRTCVATHSESERTLWTVKWLPKTGRNEGFATGGANRSIAFYREATGG